MNANDQHFYSGDVLADEQVSAKERYKTLITTDYTALPPDLCTLIFDFDNTYHYITELWRAMLWLHRNTVQWSNFKSLLCFRIIKVYYFSGFRYPGTYSYVDIGIDLHRRLALRSSILG